MRPCTSPGSNTRLSPAGLSELSEGQVKVSRRDGGRRQQEEEKKAGHSWACPTERLWTPGRKDAQAANMRDSLGVALPSVARPSTPSLHSFTLYWILLLPGDLKH